MDEISPCCVVEHPRRTRRDTRRDETWRKRRGVVEHLPGIEDSLVQPEEVGEASPEPTAHDVLRDMMAAGSNTFGHSRHGEIGIRERQEHEVRLVPGKAQLAE